MNKKLGQEPAFPLIDISDGMNKRFYAACAAMQGLINSFSVKRLTQSGFIAVTDHSELIRESYQLADELLKQEYNE